VREHQNMPPGDPIQPTHRLIFESERDQLFQFLINSATRAVN
jgi:hypothetical protein